MTGPRKFEQRSFLQLPENQLAIAAVKRLAPGLKRRLVRLVCLIGPPGVGKSHLARELMRSWEQERPDGKLILVTASQFAAQLAEASSDGAIAQFQKRFRHDVALLICEDLQTIAPRRESQQQLLAALDDVTAHGGLALVTATQMPGEIRGLSRRLVNRLHGGVCVAIAPPGPASRRQLLARFLDENGVKVAHAELEAISRQHAVSPRELQGLAAQIKTERGAQRTAAEAAPGGLPQQLADRAPAPPASLAEIARVTAGRFGMKVADLKGPRRSQTVSAARQVAMYVARQVGGYNYVEIGAFFNRGNHSTVIHACRKIAAQREDDVVLDHEIFAIAEVLKSGR